MLAAASDSSIIPLSSCIILEAARLTPASCLQLPADQCVFHLPLSLLLDANADNNSHIFEARLQLGSVELYTYASHVAFEIILFC